LLAGKIHETAQIDFRLFTKPRVVPEKNSEHNTIASLDMRIQPERQSAIQLLSLIKAMAVELSK